MRKFWSESVRVPMTCAMLPARVARRMMSALMVLVVISRCCLAAMVCCSSKEARSLLESCAVRRVRTPRGVDLVEHRDFGVEIGVARERILFEVGNLRLDVLRVVANSPDGGHGRFVCAVGEFDRSVLRLDAAKFVGRHSSQNAGVVGLQWRGGLLISSVHRLAGVDPGNPWCRVAVCILGGCVPPLREQGLIACRHVLKVFGHLHG